MGMLKRQKLDTGSRSQDFIDETNPLPNSQQKWQQWRPDFPHGGIRSGGPHL
jgi:hypothetical protein